MNIDYYKKYEPIDGKWYLTKELGRGAYGTVFEIERKDYAYMKAALKVVSIPSSKSEVDSFREENYNLDDKSITSYFYGLVEEFVKEFRLMSQLKGQSNIVSYEDHDVKEKSDDFGWDIFIRMELLTPMNKFFAEHTPSQGDIIKLGIDMCRALEVCQKFKIIHRDIKPSNIFVSGTGDFKLGDFGVARTLEKTSSVLSKKGTYTYMAPEVYKGQEYSSKVDIYSLGIVMYKLLNNNLEPFRTDRTFNDGERALELRMRGDVLPKPENADGRLAEIILKACSYNPKDRYESPLQMRMELESIQDNGSGGKVISPNGDAAHEATEETQGVSEHKPVDGNESIEETVGLFPRGKEDITDEGMSTDTSKQSDENYGHPDEETAGLFPGVREDIVAEGMPADAGKQFENCGYSGMREAATPTGWKYIRHTYNNFWKQYADFKGCTSRKEFWTFILINFCLSVLFWIAILMTGGLLSLLYVIYLLATVIPGLSICTRRLHDAGRSGHWQWLYLTFFGLIIVVVLCCFKAKYNDNKYRK